MLINLETRHVIVKSYKSQYFGSDAFPATSSYVGGGSSDLQRDDGDLLIYLSTKYKLKQPIIKNKHKLEENIIEPTISIFIFFQSDSAHATRV